MLSSLTQKISRGKLEIFMQEHSSSEYTLDLGCANSPYSKWFPNRVGLDIASGPGVDVVGDAHNLPFPAAHFDRIVCTEVLEHLHSPHIAIKEMKRVLKPGGTLILAAPFMFPIHDAPHDYYRFTIFGLQHLFKDWEIVSLKPDYSSQQTFAILLQRVCYQTKMRLNKISKFILFLIAKIIYKMPNWIIKEYGDIKKSTEQKDIFAMGYYLVAKNK